MNEFADVEEPTPTEGVGMHRPNKHKNAIPEDIGIVSETVGYRLNRRSMVTVGQVKVHRLFKKNERRIANGLSPLPYDQI